MKMENSYLQQVFHSTQQVEEDLKYKPPKKISTPRRAQLFSNTHNDDQTNTMAAVDVKITGWWKWKTVIVPPNAFVVHTRKGVNKPLHCGLGISFSYDSYKDAFLVVPAAMQTIIINANCICKERQGVMVQAYVQWVIDDFNKAYRKLDFSDNIDPMKITNTQLQQQAEATVKDTVAGMSIDDVLADKQPIIQELTRRLRGVAEGNKGEDGLGLRIVTVQIKESIVSSAKLWETLQRSFRSEREKEARLAEIMNESIVREKEHLETLKKEKLSFEKTSEMRRLKHQHEIETFNEEQEEYARRARLQAEKETEVAEYHRLVIEIKSLLEDLELERELKTSQRRFEHDTGQSEKKILLDKAKREVDNQQSAAYLQAQLIRQLPQIAKSLPTPESLKIYEGGQGNQLSYFLDSILEVIEVIKRGSRAESEVRSVKKS